MRRRSFLKNSIGVMVTALLPVTIISYDPVKQVVITPPVDSSPLLAYKGATFWETGAVYAPYIPRFKTNTIQTSVDPDLLAYTKTAYPTAFR
jgi:hypothetical protein